jgi:glycosyltransferase involved in cell wall biosynthesis
MRVLFLTTNSAQAAYVRYRVLQFFPALEAAGVACTHASLFDSDLDAIIYQPGRTLEKLKSMCLATARRVVDILRAYRYDLVFIAREAYLLGPPVLEAALRTLRCPYILDIDDAVWEPYDSPTYGRIARYVKCAWKTRSLLRGARSVLAGNSYVAEYSRQYNADVHLVPTVVDTQVYRPRSEVSAIPTLGWIGSHSTHEYLRSLLPVLNRLARRAPFRLRVVGPEADRSPQGFECENVRWRADREVEEVRSFDIGLFPVIDSRWSRGKSGFKAVQYGAVGIPTVASPVGENREIVIDRETGILAESADEWLEALVTLCTQPAERLRMGRAARARVEQGFSLGVWAPRLVRIVRHAVRN